MCTGELLVHKCAGDTGRAQITQDLSTAYEQLFTSSSQTHRDGLLKRDTEPCGGRERKGGQESATVKLDGSLQLFNILLEERVR